MERVLEVLAINRAIAGALTRDEILQRVVSSTLVWSEATACVLLLRDEQGQARLGAAAGELPDGFADFSVPLDEHIVDALRRRVDAGDQDGFFGAPIVQAGALIGVLIAWRAGEPGEAEKDAFPAPHCETLLGALADQAAIALQHAERLERLEAALARTRRAEATFRELLDSTPDAMVIVNREGNIHLVNTEAERIFGYSREELLGQPLNLLIPPRFRAGHTRNHETYFQHPRRRAMGAGIELYALQKDGTEFLVEISLGPLDTADGLLVCSAIRDITERRRSEWERQKLLESEQDKSRQLTLAIREAHHRIKNNLQAISDLLSLELYAVQDPAAGEALRDSVKRVQTIALVHDLLSQDQDVEQVDFQRVADRLVPNVVHGVAQPSSVLDLHLAVPPLQLPSKQATTLALILTELVGNATKHALNHRPRGRLSVTVTRLPGECRLSVQDDGPGLPPGFSLATHANVGLRVVEALTQSDLEGTLTLTSRGGLQIDVCFPVEQAAQDEAATNAANRGR